MLYTIRHVTRFTYATAVTESVMEARMQPRSDEGQRCLHFGLSTMPASRVMMYQDHDGNIVHHFNIPGRQGQLSITAEALVESSSPGDLPDRLDDSSWARLDALTASGEWWDALNASTFTGRTPLLDAFARDIEFRRGTDPLSTMRALTAAIFTRFEYAPKTTSVDSPIDDALRERRGVCQDFSHIMIALGRSIGIPCRYVSGYLFHQADSVDRSSDGASHAWLEALLPELGWVGFDPTNNLLACDRHIRVALGRDYADVPPTRGVFKGVSAVRSELAVAVTVGTAQAARSHDLLPFIPWMSREAEGARGDGDARQQQQQQ